MMHQLLKFLLLCKTQPRTAEGSPYPTHTSDSSI